MYGNINPRRVVKIYAAKKIISEQDRRDDDVCPLLCNKNSDVVEIAASQSLVTANNHYNKDVRVPVAFANTLSDIASKWKPLQAGQCVIIIVVIICSTSSLSLHSFSGCKREWISDACRQRPFVTFLSAAGKSNSKMAHHFESSGTRLHDKTRCTTGSVNQHYFHCPFVTHSHPRSDLVA